MAIFMAALTVLFVAGMWLFLRNLPLITLSAPIEPEADDTLDEEALRDYVAQVQAATGGRSVNDLLRRRLYFSLAGLVLMLATLGTIAGTLW